MGIKEKYFVFFLLIGIIPIIVFSFIFWFSTLYGAKAKLESGAADDVSRLAGSFDYLIQSIDSAASEFSGYIYGSDEFIAAEGNQSAMENLLSGLLSRYEEIIGSDVAVFYYEKGVSDIYTSSGRIPYHEFEDAYLQGIPISDVPFFTLANRVSVPLVRLSQGYTFFFYAVPEFSFIPDASFILKVDNSSLALYMDDIFEDKPAGYDFVSQSGRVVFSSGLDDAAMDDSYEAIEYTSALSHNKLICYMDRSILYAPYYHDIFIYFGILAILAATIVLLSYKLANVSYDPIGKLISRIVGSDAGFAGSEIAAIEDEWDSMKAEAGDLERKVQQQSSVLLDMVFRNILGGRLSGTAEEIEYFLSLARWTLVYRYYQVAVIPSAAEDSETEQFFERMLSDISDPDRKFYHLHNWSDDSLIIIIASRNDDGGSNLRAVLELLSLSGNKDARIGGGRICSDIKALNVSYIEAMISSRDCPPGTFALYAENSWHIDRLVIARSDVNLFRQAVQNADSEAAVELIEKQFEMIEEGNYSPIMRQNMLYDILNMIIRTADDIGVNERVPIQPVMYDVRDIHDFHDCIIDYVEELIEKRRIDVERMQDKEKNEIIAYVDENFRSSQISLAHLSDKFGKSVSYMSRLFKASAGISFVDYLWKLRLHWIKGELAATDRPIRDIVNDSGYSDISGAMRKFKATEGCTMNQYRESARKN